MYESDQTATVAIKPCRSCGIGLIEDSKFCRSCGAAQTHSLTPDSRTMISVGNVESELLYATTRLSQQKLYHPVSGPLVGAVVLGVPARIPHSSESSLSKRILLAMMAI